mgnify:CR=1 FL=1
MVNGIRYSVWFWIWSMGRKLSLETEKIWANSNYVLLHPACIAILVLIFIVTMQCNMATWWSHNLPNCNVMHCYVYVVQCNLMQHMRTKLLFFIWQKFHAFPCYIKLYCCSCQVFIFDLLLCAVAFQIMLQSVIRLASRTLIYMYLK